MSRYMWASLNKQQLGAYAEYFVKMEFTMFGFQVYGTEVDDRGIDFVARHERRPFIEVQVKSIRPRTSSSVFIEKAKFQPDENMYLALGLLVEGVAPELFLIPSMMWRSPEGMFASRDYEGRKSKPEWGLSLSAKHRPKLQSFAFDETIKRLIG